MNALVYHGPGNRSWDAVPDPVIQAPTDVIVRVDTATICGTDLHILKGDVPECEPGTVLGHEAVGTIVEVGSAVTSFQIGNKVLVPCVTACGRCRFCKQSRYGQCSGGGGWIFGHLINGLQPNTRGSPLLTPLYMRFQLGSPTSRSFSCQTSCPPRLRWASSTGRSGRATRWRSWVPGPLVWQQS